jgi:hypothetical protein
MLYPSYIRSIRDGIINGNLLLITNRHRSMPLELHENYQVNHAMYQD